MKNNAHFDAVIIGGGFYGCEIALHLKKFFKSVCIVEKELDLLLRASSTNQARIHNGYHYPRSLLTARRSHQNYNQFISDYSPAIDSSFIKIYGIAREHSKINAQQFEIFCKNVGLPLKTPDSAIQKLFSDQYVESTYEVEEVAFNVSTIRELLKDKLKKKKVKVMTNCTVDSISQNKDILISLHDGTRITSRYCFNCSYSNINTILHNSHLAELPLKLELTEMALIEAPTILKNLGITILDGPFFSCMPFPAEDLHSLSHVRYTPHNEWIKKSNKIPKKLKSQYPFMVHDAIRYLPVLASSKYIKSMYEIKTLLKENEIDDGRPILLRKDYGGIKNLYVVMGGKIDNVYDILRSLDLSD